MLDMPRKEQVLLSGSGALGALAVGAATAISSPIVPLAAIISVALGYLLLVIPEVAIAVLLLSRPLMDLAPEALHVPGFGSALDLSAAVALLLVAAGTIYLLANRIDVMRIPLLVPFIAFLMVATASLFVSVDPAASLAAIIRLAAQFVLFLLVYCLVRTRVQVDRMLAILVAAALPPVIWGFVQILTGNPSYIHPALANGITQPRLASPFGEGLTLGTFLVLPSILVAILLLESRRGGGQLLLGGLFGFLMFSFYFTLARGPWMGFVLALLLLGAVRYRALLVLLPIIIALAVILIPDVNRRVSPVVESPDQTTAAGRVDLWSGALTEFRKHPLLGAGFGAADEEAGIERQGRTANFHNDYLRVLADTGALGLATYIWLLAAAAVSVLGALRRLKVRHYQTIALSFLAVWAAFIVIRFTGNVLTHQVYQYYFWSLAALVLALPNVEAASAAVVEKAARHPQQGIVFREEGLRVS